MTQLLIITIVIPATILVAIVTSVPVSDFVSTNQTDDESVKIASNGISNDLVPVLSISGTSLFTGIYYKLGMKRFPTGSVTWTEQTSIAEGWNFVMIDSRTENFAKYQKLGDWYNDIQWFFVPSANEEGWYTLRNKNRPEYVACRSKTAEVGSGYHITLSRNADPSDPNTLWKPVSSQFSNDDQFFTLRIKSEPNGVVTWTEKSYGETKGAHYIQVDINREPEHANKYLPGNEWHDDSLFKFDRLESELVAEITQLELKLFPKLEELRAFIHTDCDDVDSVFFTNINSKAVVRELKQQIVNNGQLSLTLNGLFSQSPDMKISTSSIAQISPPWYADSIQFHVSNEIRPSSQGQTSAPWYADTDSNLSHGANQDSHINDDNIQLTTVEKSKVDTKVVIPSWSTTEIRVCREYFDTLVNGVPVDAAVYLDISEQGDRPSGSRGKFKATQAKLPANHLANPTVENIVQARTMTNIDEKLANLEEGRDSTDNVFKKTGLQILGKSETEIIVKARGKVKGKFGFKGVVASN